MPCPIMHSPLNRRTESQRPDIDNVYEVDSGENDAYQKWIDGLRGPNASSGDDAPETTEHGVFELPGDSMYPLEVLTYRD